MWKEGGTPDASYVYEEPKSARQRDQRRMLSWFMTYLEHGPRVGLSGPRSWQAYQRKNHEKGDESVDVGCRNISGAVYVPVWLRQCICMSSRIREHARSESQVNSDCAKAESCRTKSAVAARTAPAGGGRPARSAVRVPITILPGLITHQSSLTTCHSAAYPNRVA